MAFKTAADRHSGSSLESHFRALEADSHAWLGDLDKAADFAFYKNMPRHYHLFIAFISINVVLFFNNNVINSFAAKEKRTNSAMKNLFIINLLWKKLLSFILAIMFGINIYSMKKVSIPTVYYSQPQKKSETERLEKTNRSSNKHSKLREFLEKKRSKASPLAYASPTLSELTLCSGPKDDDEALALSESNVSLESSLDSCLTAHTHYYKEETEVIPRSQILQLLTPSKKHWRSFTPKHTYPKELLKYDIKIHAAKAHLTAANQLPSLMAKCASRNLYT